jgi:hypothetical protein
MMFDLSRRSTYEAVLDNLTRVPGIVGHAQALLDTAFENEMVRMTGGVPSRRAPTSRIIDLVNVPGWSIVMLNFSLDDGRLIGLMASPDANGCDRLNEASQQWFGSSGHATRDASDFGWALGQLSIAAQGHRNRTSIEDSRRHQVSGPGYPSIERAWKGHRAAAQFMYYAARRECTFTWDALVVPVPGSE